MAFELLRIGVGKIFHLHLKDLDPVEPLLGSQVDAFFDRLELIVAAESPVAVSGDADTVAPLRFLRGFFLGDGLGGRCDGSGAESESGGLKEMAARVEIWVGDWIAHWE